MSGFARGDQTEKFGAREEGEEGIVRCHACPVICRIRPGRAGACSRYANEGGALVRTDPIVLTRRLAEEGGAVRPFLDAAADWDGALLPAGGALHHRHRGRHDLSGLQARALHRLRRI